jgi:hypothetical protein
MADAGRALPSPRHAALKTMKKYPLTPKQVAELVRWNAENAEQAAINSNKQSGKEVTAWLDGRAKAFRYCEHLLKDAGIE